MASACTRPASSSDRAAWTSRCRCKGLSPSKRELTTATRKCVSLPGGTAWASLSLRSSNTSGFKACSNFVRMAASTGPMVPSPALLRDRQTRPAMENRCRTSCPLSIGFRSASATAVACQSPDPRSSRRVRSSSHPEALWEMESSLRDSRMGRRHVRAHGNCSLSFWRLVLLG